MTGDELRKRRERMGLSQVQLGQALRVDSNTIARWEGNRQGIRHPHVLRLLLDYMNEDLTQTGPDPTARQTLISNWMTTDRED